MDEEITLKKLRIAHFLITKKRLLKKIFFATFIIIDLLIWFYFFYHFTLYLIQSKEYQEMEKELGRLVNINYEKLHKSITPLMPEIIYSKAIPLGRGRYHLICLVKNPNQNWYARSLKYHFIWSKGESPSMTKFLLPNEEKFLIIFNHQINEPPLNLTCQIEEIEWQRLRQEKKYLLEVPKQFLIKNLKYLPAQGEEERDVTTFQFINSTIYNFWQINLIVLLYQGQEIVAIERTNLKEIFSQEEREVKIIWPSSFSFVSEIKVLPEINVFDPLSFMSSIFQQKKD
ncbi:MAG: hypothetical protein N2259_01455 [Patescibacteria group bacterium]|nr:hypothetical protein [Patescibacteria group bacterium]